MTRPTILWDFDGTLAIRPGMWGGTLLEILDAHEPGHGISREDLRPGLRHGFPWHEHQHGHEHLNSPDLWWAHIGRTLVRALRGAGLTEGRASELAAIFPSHYLEPSRWQVVEGARDALDLSTRAGWQNVIVSNHTPELADLVDGLGLGHHVEVIVTSARHGFEKPHRRAFEVALSMSGNPETAWMVGDNPIADMAGASRVGVPGVWIQPKPLSNEAMEHLDAHYAHNGWSDWRDHCHHTAKGPLDAAELILRQTSRTSSR